MLKSSLPYLFLVVALTASRASAESYSDYCVPISRTQQYARVAFPVVSEYRGELRFDQPPLKEMSLRGYLKCNVDHVKPFIVEGETLVGEEITVEGNICSPFPQFVIYRAYEFRQLYPGRYITGRSAGQMSPHPMDFYTGVALASVMKRCGGKKPDRLHFKARRVEDLPREVHFQAVKGKIKKPSFVKNDFYSSTVHVNDGYKIINDDPAKEAAFLKQQGISYDAAMRKKEEDARDFAVGAILGMLILGNAQQDCPIDDSSCR